MANTVTQTKVIDAGTGNGWVVKKIEVVSDGTEETDLVVYDNSDHINVVSVGVLKKIEMNGSDCSVQLEWDQTTDSPIVAFNPSTGQTMDFNPIGGFKNPAGTGATGDLLLTTANLDAGDAFTIILHIWQVKAIV